MANPILAIISIAGVAGAGTLAATVNHQVLEQSQQPVVVTVEGEPVVIGGGLEALLPSTPKTAPDTTTRQVNQSPAVQTPAVQAPAVQTPAVQTPPVAEPVAPAPAPSTHTGASGGTKAGENESEKEYNDDSVQQESEQEESDD